MHFFLLLVFRFKLYGFCFLSWGLYKSRNVCGLVSAHTIRAHIVEISNSSCYGHSVTAYFITQTYVCEITNLLIVIYSTHHGEILYGPHKYEHSAGFNLTLL